MILDLTNGGRLIRMTIGQATQEASLINFRIEPSETATPIADPSGGDGLNETDLAFCTMPMILFLGISLCLMAVILWRFSPRSLFLGFPLPPSLNSLDLLGPIHQVPSTLSQSPPNQIPSIHTFGHSSSSFTIPFQPSSSPSPSTKIILRYPLHPSSIYWEKQS